MLNYQNVVELRNEEVSAAFKAMGHPHRLTIMRRLLSRALRCCSADRNQNCALDPASCNVGELAKGLAIAPSTVSHHLKELAAAGLIERVRDGRFLYCRANEARLGALRRILKTGETHSTLAHS